MAQGVQQMNNQLTIRDVNIGFLKKPVIGFRKPVLN